MEKIPVTKEEFLQAMDTIKRYGIQVFDQNERLRIHMENHTESKSETPSETQTLQPILFSPDTLVADCDLSVRTSNALKTIVSTYRTVYPYGGSKEWKELTIAKLGEYSRKELSLYRNVGPVTIKEIENLLLKAGIVMKMDKNKEGSQEQNSPN